jgi:uncharacterized integral membrane protein
MGPGPDDEALEGRGGAEAPEGVPAPEQETLRMEAEHLRQLRRERQARVAKVLVVLGVGVLFAVFVLANAQPVTVDFVFVEGRPRLIWVMLACAVLGGVLGYLVGRPGRRARRLRARGGEGAER